MPFGYHALRVRLRIPPCARSSFICDDRCKLWFYAKQGEYVTDFFSLPTETSDLFPRHGWVRNSAGVGQLRLPLLRLYEAEEPYYGTYCRKQVMGVWLQSRNPKASIRMLAVCLRDLNVEFRAILKYVEAGGLGCPDNFESRQIATRYYEALHRSELLIFSAFVLLRRLADQIMDATRPLLFEHWKSSPKQMKTAIKAAKEGTLSAHAPSCDVERLTRALIERTQWFEDLRNDGGVRDILVHKEHIFLIGAHGEKSVIDGDFSWRVYADLTQERSGVLASVDVVTILRRCLLGLCDFMEEICLSVAVAGDFGPGDFVYITGSDLDVTAFWPSVHR